MPHMSRSHFAKKSAGKGSKSSLIANYAGDHTTREYIESTFERTLTTMALMSEGRNHERAAKETELLNMTFARVDSPMSRQG